MCKASFSEILFSCLAVILACIGAAYSIAYARRNGNWLLYISTAGCVVFVLGLVFQRSAAPVGVVAAACPADTGTGIFDTNIGLPLTGLQVNLVTLAGILLNVASLCLVLVFERVSDPRREVYQGPASLSLEDEDAV